jgi:uncharacterized OB-fold protein
VFNPAVVCPVCSSQDLLWENSSGRGTVYSWTVAWRPMSPAFIAPYVPLIVTLDEGWQMVSALVECEPTDVRIGLRVEVVFQAYQDLTLPYFRPSAS